MPKKKHTKKHPVIPCTDANQMVRESTAEKNRIAEAMQKRFERLKAEYEEEMKRRENEKDVISNSIKKGEENAKANSDKMNE